MDKSIDLGNLIIPIIKPIKGVDYFTVEEVQQMINEVFNRVNPTVEQAETARQNNETTRQNNEISRQNNENIRQQNEEAREIIKERVETLIEEIQRKLDNGEFIGEQGVGITNISFSENYTIIIHLSDGTVYESGSIRGEQGERGEKGDTPERGVDYWTGEDKREIIQDVENDINIPDLQERLQDAEKNQLTGQASGESIDLSDSADSRVRSIELEGNSEQKSTTGKNLLPDYLETETKNGVTLTNNGDGTYTLNGTATAATTFVFPSSKWVSFGDNGTYYFSSNYYISGLAYAMYYGSGQLAFWKTSSGTLTLEAQLSNARFQISIESGKSFSNQLITPMIEKGSTATSFEPYTGGQASPNPSYPQEIHSTGDSGSVNEKVQNRNLAESTTTQILTPIAHFNNYSGDITVAVKLTGGTSQFNYKLFFEDGTQQDFAIATRNSENKWYCSNRSVQNLNALSLYNVDNSNPRTVEKVFIAKGTYQITSDDDYIDHEEQIYSIPTQQPMRAIGEYKDTFVKVDGNWYERHYIGQKIFDGTETTLFYLANYQGFRYQLEDANLVSSNPQNDLMCSHFKVSNIRGINGSPEPPIIRTYYGTTGLDAKYIFICDGNTDVNVFKTWLSNNNVELIYVLETPVDLPCTEEQIETLESLEKARTYKSVTHISSEDTVPATIDLTYVKDLETVINNLGGA